MSDNLRKQIIRLAQQNPELRAHLLPLIKASFDDQGILAEGCPDNLDPSECKEWEANTEKYKNVVKDQHKTASDEIGKTILEQMGGARRLMVMLGVKKFVLSNNGVSFAFPNKERAKGNAVRITLDPDDTYTMEFLNATKAGTKTVKKLDGVYAEDLAGIFERQTGWYLRMASKKANYHSESLERAYMAISEKRQEAMMELFLLNHQIKLQTRKNPEADLTSLLTQKERLIPKIEVLKEQEEKAYWEQLYATPYQDRRATLQPIVGPRPGTRPLYEIAKEIRKDWGSKVNFAAKPYLEALSELDSIRDSYGSGESAKSMVLYFLSNAGSWKGETAARVKKELKQMAGIK